MPRETGRQRRRNADSDESSSEDEEQQQTTTTTTTTTTVTAPEAPTAPAAVTAPAPAPPARVRAKAPAAAAVSAPSMTLHADPAAAAAAAGEKEEDSGSDDDEEKKEDEEEDEEDEEESVMDEAAAAAAAQMRQLAEEMAAVDYETLTYAALLEILKRASRPQLEETMAQREQLLESAVQQQQNERVERFLDMMGTSSPTAAAAAAAAAATAAAAADANGSSADAATAATEGYRYNAMLTRLFEALNRNNEGSAMTERNQLPVPILERMGKKKTVITNFGRICDAFHRPMEDVKDFIEKELSIRGNLDSNSALILKLEIRRQTDFDRVLIKYLDEYVKCNSCHRINTTLTKDGRRLELRCNVCTATRTVTAAGTATFSAQIEKRSRQRAAMTL